MSNHDSEESALPGKNWEQREPAQLGVDAALLDQLANQLGGRGCVVKDGYVVKAWGDQAQGPRCSVFSKTARTKIKKDSSKSCMISC